jgi:hypothetical protein
MAGRMLFHAGPEPRAQFLRALRNVRKTFEQRAQIQSRADGEYRQSFPLPEIFQNAHGPLSVAPRGCVILWAKNVNQMMRNAAAFEGARFCGANVKTASLTPSADFPDAVGPTTTTRGRSALISLIERGDAAPEQKEK